MCIICVDFQKQLLTAQEARRVLTEMILTLDEDHLVEIHEMLEEAEEEND